MESTAKLLLLFALGSGRMKGLGFTSIECWTRLSVGWKGQMLQLEGTLTD